MYAFFGGDDFEYQPSKLASVFTSPLKGKINILVLGVDEREDDVGRSDTTFVITIDTAAKKVTMLSIPRDSRVKIAGHGWDKINHAYAFGGSKLSKATVENLLGISIDYTVVMNFNGFVRMIDALGGVTIDVGKRMCYSDPYDDDGGLYIDLHPGVQRLEYSGFKEPCVQYKLSQSSRWHEPPYFLLDCYLLSQVVFVKGLLRQQCLHP